MLRRVKLVSALLIGAMASPLIGQEAMSRTIPFAGGRVVVTRERDADHVAVMNDRGDLTAESWCFLADGNYDELSAFFARLTMAVKEGRPEAVASMVRYPLRVNGARSGNVVNRQQLLQRYSQVFTDAVLTELRTAAPQAPFCRDGQAMIGSGAVWVRANRGRVAIVTVNR